MQELAGAGVAGQVISALTISRSECEPIRRQVKEESVIERRKEERGCGMEILGKLWLDERVQVHDHLVAHPRPGEEPHHNVVLDTLLDLTRKQMSFVDNSETGDGNTRLT